MQHHFLCNISYVVIAESMGMSAVYVIQSLLVGLMSICQFLRARANIHTVLGGQKHVYCIHGNNGLEKLIVIDQSLALYAV